MAQLSHILAPIDGRFGSGPSKVRPEQVAVLSGAPLGTSHRQQPVKQLVGNIRRGLAELFALPEDYEVLLGNGGASALWDAIPFNLVESTAQIAVIGEFSGKAARAVTRAPWLEGHSVVETTPGKMITNHDEAGIDSYLYAHNETSTGAVSPLRRYGDAKSALTIVDGTSIAGGVNFNPRDVDFYYFSPQKCFAADGGLWLAFASPAAIERIERLQSQRWVPDFLNLQIALANSRKDQTLNTPAISTLSLLHSQVNWMLENGGLSQMASRSKKSSQFIYDWAINHPLASPFIKEEEHRSPVVTTIDFDASVPAKEISASLRQQGIVDIDPYRSLGRNQLRIATFPAIDFADVEALVSCINKEIERLAH
ncbi:phosphoserine transaminase [Arcanobacterium ihumii]|uniref:phosphoserine transaminase n=1 Tax=Arcanobacterium ihumii TaxID=2138162 RepID=UPI000F51DA20|nr:phosphoserine transaminase [Arcanobacterium ihumii]